MTTDAGRGIRLAWSVGGNIEGEGAVPVAAAGGTNAGGRGRVGDEGRHGSVSYFLLCGGWLMYRIVLFRYNDSIASQMLTLLDFSLRLKKELELLPNLQQCVFAKRRTGFLLEVPIPSRT